MKMHLKNLSDI